MRFFSSLFAIAFIALLFSFFSQKVSAVTITGVSCVATPRPTAYLDATIQPPQVTVQWNVDGIYCGGQPCTGILTYTWSGDVNPGSTGGATSKTYTSLGQKHAHIHVSDPSGSTADNDCYVNISDTPPANTPTPTPNALAPTPTPATGMCGIGAPDAPTFASKLFGCGISLVGGTAMLFIIYGGYMLISSTGDPTRLRKGKEYVTYAVVGLILAILALVILQVIGLDILRLPGFGT